MTPLRDELAKVVCPYVTEWERLAVYDREELLQTADRILSFLTERGLVIVPREPTEEMLAAAKPSMEGVENCLAIAHMHGSSLQWHDGKPPLYHAYRAMLSAAVGKGE